MKLLDHIIGSLMIAAFIVFIIFCATVLWNSLARDFSLIEITYMQTARILALLIVVFYVYGALRRLFIKR